MSISESHCSTGLNLALRDNFVESAVASSITTSNCGKVTFFDNRTTDERLLPYLDPATLRPREELDSPAEAAFVLACFDKR